MKNKSKLLRSLMMLFVMAITLVLAACGEKATMFAITWEVPAEAKVAVENYDNLPAEVKEGEKIVFTVTPNEGFLIKTVKANTKKVNAKNGKYSIEINEAKTIKVEVKKEVSGVIVEANPTNLTYYAGEALDTTGMVVKAKFADNTTEIIEMGVNGYAVSPSVFEGGETEVTIIYEGFQAKVELAQRVDFKVEINPDGGEIAASWLDAVKARNLNNFNITEEGVISFTYFDELADPIKLPTADEITKKDHVFLGWSENGEISNASKASVSTKAGWQGELVSFEKVDITVEDDIPYLILEGKFKLANEVYLKLYEGNVAAGFKGDTYTNEGGYGSKFYAKFDLRKLVEARTDSGETFEGKWMDITFYAGVGENEVMMDVFIGEESKVQVDMSKKVDTTGQTFTFAEYNKLLKVYYMTKHYTYTIDTVTEANDTFVVINGQANLEYANQHVELSWEFDGPGKPLYTADIDADGKFQIKMNLKDFMIGRQGFAHVTFYKDSTDTPTLGGATTNLAISQCRTKLEDVNIAGTDIKHAITIDAGNGYLYYIGNAWDGLMLFVKDNRINYKNVELKLIDGAVYYCVSGSYSGLTKEQLAFMFDLEHSNPLDGHNWGDRVVPANTACDKIEINETDKTFVASFNVSTPCEEGFKAEASEMWALLVHFGVEGNYGDLKQGTAGTEKVTLNGIEYSLKQDGETWDIISIILKPVTE